MHVWNVVLHAARWKYRTQKLRQKSPSKHRRTTLSGYIFTTKACIDNRKKNLLNGNISSIYLYSVVTFGPLKSVICWRVWGTPANVHRFRVLASLRHRRHSTDVNQILHDDWPSPALVQYVCILGGSCPLTEFCQLQNSLCVQLLCSPKLAALLHGTLALASAKVSGVVQGNGIAELSQRAPPIFGRAAITLGIGPHSS